MTRPGARVSARTGYALAAGADAGRPQARDRARVLGAPFVQQGLKLDYTTYVMKAAEAGQHRVVLSLTADLPVRSTPSDTADVVFVARDVRDGRVVASGSDTMPLPAAPHARGRRSGTGTWRVQFNVPAGDYMMRTVVREPGGLVGSADRRFDVRPLDGPDVTASDLVIGSALGGLPVRPRAYADDGLTGMLETYGRTPAQLEGLDARTWSCGAPTTATRSRAWRRSCGRSRRTRRRRHAASDVRAAADGVAPGNYLAHAMVSRRRRGRRRTDAAGRGPCRRAHRHAAAGAAARRRHRRSRSRAAIWRGSTSRGSRSARRARRWPTPRAAPSRAAGKKSDLALRRTPDGQGRHCERAARLRAVRARGLRRARRPRCSAALDAEPNALTAFFLGWAQDGAGNSRGALSAWRSAAHLDPSLVSAHLALADGYLKLSQPALAIQALRAGLAALPSSAELQSRLQQLERGTIVMSFE